MPQILVKGKTKWKGQPSSKGLRISRKDRKKEKKMNLILPLGAQLVKKMKNMTTNLNSHITNRRI